MNHLELNPVDFPKENIVNPPTLVSVGHEAA
jgi:hypothetical protein